MPVDGLITLRSHFGQAETMTRLEAAIRASGMHVLARIDHAAAARQAGIALLPTSLMIFGDVTEYAAFINAMRLTAFDLPFKALVWQDAAGETWLSHEDMRWMATRYGVPQGFAGLVVDAAVMLDTVVRKAVLPP